MLRLLRATAVSLTLGVVGLVAGAASSTAADGPCGRNGAACAQGSTDGGTVTVTVTGTGTDPGGRSVTLPRHTTTVSPVCYYRFLMSGTDYAAAWAADGQFSSFVRNVPDEDKFDPETGYQAHADDPDGGYWFPFCNAERWTGDDAAYDAVWKDYYATHSTVYVEADETPPGVDEVRPEDLAQAAYESITPSAGTLHWNPTRTGDAATFVGMETWVWLDDLLTSVSATATIPAGTSATVTARLEGIEVSDSGNLGTAVGCTGPGTPWTATATGTPCAITFDRSSARLPVLTGHDLPTTHLTARETWTASWTSNVEAGVHALPDLDPITAGADVAVAEIETLSIGG